MANMNAMGGPVRDAPMAMTNNCAVAPHGAPRQRRENDKKRTQMNTYIYEYFLCYGMLDCAYAILNADSGVKVQKHSPGSPHDDKGGWLRNALPDESIETGLDSKRLELLPAPNVPNLSPEGCFLYEWFCLFWDIFKAQKDECESSETQGSSLLPHHLDGATLNTFYNPSEMGEGDMTPGTSGGEAGGRSHRDLQEYQMQAMQLTSMDQQNKELIARHDTSGLRRNDGVPGGRGGQGSPRGSQCFQQPALQGGVPGASHNAANQMNRSTQQVNISGMGAHLPENSRSRGYPNSINFIVNQINSNLEPHFFKAGIGGINGNMAAVQTDGWTGPHRSHPSQQFNGQTIRQQVTVTQAQCQQQEQTGQNGLIQWQGDSNGNQVPQAAQTRVQSTPQERSVAPSSAPAKENDSAKTRSTTPSPPQTTKAAPPTLSRSNKGARKKGTAPKKVTKNIKSKTVSQKTSKSNLNSGATPAAKIAPGPVPPVSPVNLKKEAQNTGPAQVVPTGQPAPLPLAPAPIVAQPHDDLTQNMTFSMENPDMTDFGSIDFASLSATDDGFHDFDFDSFLQISADETGGSHLNYAPFDMDTGEIDRD
ncbi:hypothetical protein FOBRF1_007026 [Fusarium oxysporum]